MAGLLVPKRPPPVVEFAVSPDPNPVLDDVLALLLLEAPNKPPAVLFRVAAEPNIFRESSKGPSG